MKTLVLYASKHACTKDCVDELTKKLTGNTETYNLEKDSIPSLDSYDIIIIGGSIYAGFVQKSVKSFCEKQAEMLSKKKVALFLCCATPESINDYWKNNYPENLVNNAIIKECFGGEFRFSSMGFFEKAILKMVSKNNSKMPSILHDKIDSFAVAVNKLMQ